MTDIAIMGIYFFDGNVSKYAKTLKPSRRRETEIVDLIKIYLKKKKLDYQLIKKLIWSDVGTISDYNNISNFVKLKEKATKIKIACLEEISLKNKWITKKQIKKNINFYGDCEYSNYLKKIV